MLDKRVGVLIDVLEENNFVDEKAGFLIGTDINEYIFLEEYSYKKPLFIKNKEILRYVKNNYSYFKKNASKYKKCFKNNEITKDFSEYLKDKNISIIIEANKITLKWEIDFGNFDKNSEYVQQVLNYKEIEYSNSINNIRNQTAKYRPEIRAFSFYNVRNKISIKQTNHLDALAIENDMHNIKFTEIIEIFFDEKHKKRCLDSIRYKN